MLENNRRFYPGQDDKDGEDEEEEEGSGGESTEGVGQNGGLESPEEREMRGGQQSWEGKAGNAMKPAAIVVGRQRADRPPKPAVTHLTNQAQAHHHAASKQHQLNAAYQQPQHPGPGVPQKRRALMERSMTAVAPPEDAFLTMMVFRVGIPDIKQTVGACCTAEQSKDTSTLTVLRDSSRTEKRQIWGLCAEDPGVEHTQGTQSICEEV